jgi:hypothetical protein
MAPLWGTVDVKHGLDVRPRAGEQVVIKDIPAIHNRQQPRNGITFPHRAEPAASRAAARREAVSELYVSGGHELGAAIAIRHAADLDRRNVTPLLGLPLGALLVVREGAINMHLVRFGQHVRRAEVCKRIVWRCLGTPRENANQSHAFSALKLPRQ